MGKLLEQGRLAIVQGVGYPNPDRSHFRSHGDLGDGADLEAGARGNRLARPIARYVARRPSAATSPPCTWGLVACPSR